MSGVMDAKKIDDVMQAVRFQCYRENIYGALELVESAHAQHPDPVVQAALQELLNRLDQQEKAKEADLAKAAVARL